MTDQIEGGKSGEGIFTLGDIDNALFTISDIQDAIGSLLFPDSDSQNIYPEEKEISWDDLGLVFHNNMEATFFQPSEILNIHFTEEEGILFRFFIEHPGKPHRIDFLSEKMNEIGYSFSLEYIHFLIKNINQKLGDKLFFACGISHYSQIPVLHGIKTIFKKNGKILVVNKLRRIIEWENNRVVIDDMDFFLKIYECFKHISFDDGVLLNKEYAEKMRELRIPLEEKKGGKFSL